LTVKIRKNIKDIIAMTSQVLTASAQSSHSLQSVESHIERLFQEIEVLLKEKKEVENVKKYTVEINKKMSKIEAEIETRKLAIDHCQTMLNLPPGSWVRNGTTKPGKVIDLVIAGRVPEVHVQWHGASISVPESPAKLTLVSPDLVEYVWNGDRYPKLVRIIDGWECDEIEILEQKLAQALENKEDPDRRFKLTYCRKRIEVIDQEDLVNLERAVRQGLQVFYRVGEALAEIRDRKLYKQHGFTDFRDYLRDYWNMGKSRAYQLIESAEVMKNITESKGVPNGGQNLVLAKSVHHGGQNYPKSERITRELAKAPPEQQAEAWKKAVETAPDHNPTAVHTRAVVADIINKESLNTINQKTIINDFAVGQLVQIKSDRDRSDKRLVGYKNAYALITKIFEHSVNLQIWAHQIENVAKQDIEAVSESINISAAIEPKYLSLLMENYDSLESFIMNHLHLKLEIRQQMRQLAEKAKQENFAYLI
jgi:hypothetical protein